MNLRKLESLGRDRNRKGANFKGREDNKDEGTRRYGRIRTARAVGGQVSWDVLIMIFSEAEERSSRGSLLNRGTSYEEREGEGRVMHALWFGVDGFSCVGYFRTRRRRRVRKSLAS